MFWLSPEIETIDWFEIEEMAQEHHHCDEEAVHRDERGPPEMDLLKGLVEGIRDCCS